MGTRKNKTSGPDPERVKIDEPWEKAVGKAIKKPKPPEGWPVRETKKRPKKK